VRAEPSISQVKLNMVVDDDGNTSEIVDVVTARKRVNFTQTMDAGERSNFGSATSGRRLGRANGCFALILSEGRRTVPGVAQSPRQQRDCEPNCGRTAESEPGLR
jgi:hypothetical protein